MNVQIKLLTDALVATARTLDEVYTSAALSDIELDTSAIEMVLIEASEALATIKPEDSGGNTWKYNGAEQTCEGDSCHK